MRGRWILATATGAALLAGCVETDPAETPYPLETPLEQPVLEPDDEEAVRTPAIQGETLRAPPEQ